MSTRIAIVDDQALVRAGFAAILEIEDDLEVVGEFDDGLAAVDGVPALAPDVVLMDVRMPGLDGIEATRRLLRPAGPMLRVLVLTTFDQDDLVYDAMRAGASGFILKDVPRADLVSAVRTVARGEAMLSPRVVSRLVERFTALPRPGNEIPRGYADLTAREAEVFTLVARGRTNAEIAAVLFLGEATVRTHVSHIFEKMGLRDRVQAVVAGYESGLIRPGEHD